MLRKAGHTNHRVRERRVYNGYDGRCKDIIGTLDNQHNLRRLVCPFCKQIACL